MQALQLCALCVPDNTQLELQLQCGPVTLTTNSAIAEHGHGRWDECLAEKRFQLPIDRSQTPDVFLNLMCAVAPTPSRARLARPRASHAQVHQDGRGPEAARLHSRAALRGAQPAARPEDATD